MAGIETGDLSKVPFAELLGRLYRERVSGALDLQSGKAQSRVFFRLGEVKGAISNSPSNRIGQRLKAGGFVGDEQIERALGLREKGYRFGQALVRDGAISAEALEEELRNLASDIVLGTFDWPAGVWRFTPSENPAPAEVLLSLSTAELILEGARKMTDDRPIEAAFRDSALRLRITEDAVGRLGEVTFDKDEEAVFRELAHSLPLGELEGKTSFDRSKLIRFLYGLLQIGILGEAGATEKGIPPAVPEPARAQPLAGTLARTPLAELFRWIFRDRLSGFLDLQNGSDQRRVYFVDGEVKSAVSNAPSNRTGQFLKDAGLVTEEQVAAALARRAEGVRFGHALVSLGAISKEKLDGELRRLVSKIVSVAFSWQAGNFRFTPSEKPVPTDVMLSISTADLILDAIRHIPSDEIVLRELGDLSVPMAWGDDPFLRLQRITLRPDEHAAIQILDERRSTASLLESNLLPRERFLRLLAGLMVTGIVRKADRPDESPQRETGEKVALNVGVVATRRTTKLYRQAVGTAPPEFERDEIVWRRKKILSTFENLASLSPNDLLEVSYNPTFRELRWNYNLLVELFHPDNSFKPDYADLRPKLEAISKKLNASYRQLAITFGKDKVDG